MRVGALAVLAALCSQPLRAETPIAAAFRASLTACEQWVLQPKTWAADLSSFTRNVGLSDVMVSQATIPEPLQPPRDFRVANHHWRIAAGADNGVFLTTSDRVPMCHIAAGGSTDLEPDAEAVLASPTFLSAWKSADHTIRGDMATDRFISKVDPKFELIVSRASKPGDRTDRVQFLATAIYTVEN